MTAAAWSTYNKGRQYFLDGTVNFSTDTPYALALFTSSSNCNDETLSAPIYGTLTNELANGSGYTTGGASVTSMGVSFSTGTCTVTASALPTWTASGGSLTFRFGVIYINATVNSIVKPLLLWTVWDNTPADKVISNGDGFIPQINASGLFTLTGM